MQGLSCDAEGENEQPIHQIKRFEGGWERKRGGGELDILIHPYEFFSMNTFRRLSADPRINIYQSKN